jgi:hypothetical protein
MKPVFLAALVLVAGCDSDPYAEYSEYIEQCHNNVHNAAKYQAEIVSTDKAGIIKVGERTKFSRTRVEGHAKLQNGFGAWSNYTYRCVMISKGSRDLTLEEGYER